MSEFWESLFQKERTSWGFEPSDSAIFAAELFHEKGFADVLIPGIGYGRNCKPFIDQKMQVTGIEISKTAIEILNELYSQVIVQHDSVLNMPLDKQCYDGIFCYALLHLFGTIQRKLVISNCFQQLKVNGLMIFSVISHESTLIKTGEQIGPNRYNLPNGLEVYFYDDCAIKKEFSNFGLVEYRNIDEPVKFREGLPPMKFKLIICKKL